LCPFAQTNSRINPDNFKIVEYVIYRMGSGADAFSVLVVYHVHGKWLPTVRKIFPPFYFVNAKLNWWRIPIIAMMLTWVKPRQLDLRELHLVDLPTFDDNGSRLCDVSANCPGFNRFTKE
jgi:hypothetical protein